MTAKRRVLRVVKNTQHSQLLATGSICFSFFLLGFPWGLPETSNLSLPLAAQHPKRKRSNQPVLSAVQKEGTMKLIQVMGNTTTPAQPE